MKVTFALSRGEAEELRDEIGDLPRSSAGPKLMELYVRLDSILSIDWSKRKKKKKEGDDDPHNGSGWNDRTESSK